MFNTARAFGGDNTFVVSSSGHIQSLVNPPGNPKSRFLVNPKPVADADAWLAGAQATEHVAATGERSGGMAVYTILSVDVQPECAAGKQQIGRAHV